MKKLLSVLLASAMAVSAVGGLAACGKNGPSLTVWAPQESHEAYEALVKEFKEVYPDYAGYDIKFEAKGEGDVQSAMGTDPANGADVFFFPSDHFANMLKKGYLQPLTSNYVDSVHKRDKKEVYEFVETDGKTYAFPTTDDNGYFLYYNSKYLTEEDVKTLDAIQAKAKTLEKHVMFDYANSYYAPAFYFAVKDAQGGCSFGYTDLTMVKYKADIDNKYGQAVTKALVDYFSIAKNGPAGDDQVISTGNLVKGIADGTFIAGVSGTWDYSNIKKEMEKAGAKEKFSDIKMTILPKMRATIEGGTEEWYQMGAFVGGKYCGVNKAKSEESIPAAMALADWLTNEKGQEARFNATTSGPSNVNVSKKTEVQNSPALKAYLAQKEANGVIQAAQSDEFWGDSGIKNLVNKIATQEITAVSEALAGLTELANGLTT